MHRGLQQWLALAVVYGMVAGCAQGEAPDDELSAIREPEAPGIATAAEALAGAYIPTIDPHTMNDAEIGKVLGEGSFCAFRYTSTGSPVVALRSQRSATEPDGVVLLNGKLVALEAVDDPNGNILAAGEVRITLTMPQGQGEPSRAASARPVEAEMVFQIGDRLRVGYGGYYACAA